MMVFMSTPHLTTFSCIAYVHVDLETRDMFDAKALKCYFVNHGYDMFRYSILDEKIEQS